MTRAMSCSPCAANPYAPSRTVPVERACATRQRHDRSSAGEASTAAAATRRTGSEGGMSDWQALDDLTAELRGANTAWAERVDALAGEGEPLARLTADVDQQFAALGVREALEALAQRALAGAATIYEARRPFGYARSATLAWHPAADLRAELAGGEREELLTLDVAVGPRLLLGAGEGVPADDRLAVLIMGEKR